MTFLKRSTSWLRKPKNLVSIEKFSMACGLHYDSFLKNHDPGPTHPEGTERTSFVYEELKKTDLLNKTIRLKNDPCEIESQTSPPPPIPKLSTEGNRRGSEDTEHRGHECFLGFMEGRLAGHGRCLACSRPSLVQLGKSCVLPQPPARSPRHPKQGYGLLHF